MAEELYHAFTVTSAMRYRVIVVAEQRVHGRWLQMATTELSTFSARRHPRMPTRPPPAPPVATAEDQVVPEDPAVPQGPPVAPSPPPEDQAVPQGESEDQMVPQSLQETSTQSDAPGAMRVRRRRRTPPPRPAQPPRALRGPPHHDVYVPPWGRQGMDIWFECPMCSETTSHSAVVCAQCGARPACCRCIVEMETHRHSAGRCPYCRYTGFQ